MPVPDDIKDLLGGGENEAHWRKRLSDQGELKAPPRKSTWRRFMDSMEESMRRGPAGLITSVVAPLVETGDGKSYGERRADMAAKENQRRKDYDAVNAPEGIGELATDFGGAIAGSIISDPTNLVGGGAKTIGGKALNAAGVGAVADTALQGGEIAAGIRDEYDPVQGAVNVAAGPAFIGGIEFAKKIGNKFGTVTSTLRSPARNKKVGGAKNSHHLRGNAIDIARGKGVTHKQLENAYRRAGYDIIESLDEGDHSHFAFNFKGGKKSGGVVEDFDFRPPEQRAEIHDLLAGKDPVADFAPPLDSSHEKFTPYVERPNTPANDQIDLNRPLTPEEMAEDAARRDWDEMTNTLAGQVWDPVKKKWIERDADGVFKEPLEDTLDRTVLTPAERQEMDASAVRPDIPPITPAGLGKGSVATTPVNDLRATRRSETLPGSRDGSEDYPLPPGPNDPNFPKPGTPGNRGGPKGGDDGGSPYDGLSPEDKILQGLRDARPVSREQKRVYHEERSRRASRLDHIQQEGRGEAGVYQARASLKGEMPKVDYESISEHFSQQERDYLVNKINSTNALLPFEKQKAQDAVLRLIGKDGIKIPTPGEIELLQDVFSKDITEAIIGKQVEELSKSRVAGEILNMPRSWMSSGDISGIGRQAAMLVGDKEFWSAYPEAIKNAMSEGNYQKMLQEIKDNPNYKLAKQGGLAVRDTGSLNLHDREDFFMSNFAEHIPLEDKPVIGKAAKAYNESVGKMVRASDRAYGVLRKIRMDVFDRLIEAGREAGIDWEKSPHKVKVLSEFINSATGRGSLEVFGFNFESAAPLLNAMFFSPRLNMGRVRMMSPFFLYKMAKADPFIAKTYGKTMGKFLGAQALVLSLAVAGGATVELDPRSADAYKIKIGNTRLDTWGGFQQFARLFAQNITRETVTQKGKKKSLTSGKYGADTVWDVNERFVTNKFAPIPGVIRDWWKGKDPVGEEFSAKTKAGELVMPMGFQQVLEALKEEGPTAAWTIIPSFLGIGVTTYEPKPTKKKNSQVPDDVKDLLGAK